MKIIRILIFLMGVDFLLLLKPSRRIIGKIIKRNIEENEEVASNVMLGLLVGFMIFSLEKGNFMLVLSTCFILAFLIFKGFNYEKK